MPRSYSLDLRERVIKMANKGIVRKEIVNTLDISLSSVNRWIKLNKDKGDIKPKEYNKTGNRTKIIDLSKFEKFVKENNKLSLKEMALRWGNISYMGISKTLKRMNYIFKKDHGYIKSDMKT